MVKHLQVAVLFCCMVSGHAFAWSDHANLIWPLLRTMPSMLEPSLIVEELDDFLAAEAAGIERVLAEHEQWSRDKLKHYAPRPAPLKFMHDAENLRSAFLAAIRVNPTLDYRPYRQLTVDDDVADNAELLGFSALSFLDGGVSHADIEYLPLMPGTEVAPAHVLASASDEPDFGMDVGLFTDNGTPFGRRYGFASQPFGNPNLDYSSQAPFHMGFYQLDWLTRTAQPGLLRTYPEWRVALYRELAQFAFATGHSYWGWRFMGWALHYIGDLTQPYHVQPLPGVSTAAALWALVWGRTDEMVQLVSNRHGVLESYQYQRVTSALQQREWSDPILAAITGGEPVPVFGESTLRSALCTESIAAGGELDATLEAYMPAQFVADPAFEWTGSGEEAAIVDSVARAGGAAALAALDTAVAVQMRRFSRYSRAWIELAAAYSRSGQPAASR